MGNSSSQDSPSEKDCKVIVDNTRIKENEISKVWDIYHNLGIEFNKGGIKDSETFGKALGISNKRFAKIVFDVFDATEDKRVSFYEFAYGISALSQRATINEKAAFVFSIYDENKDGYIDDREFNDILMCCLYNETDDESSMSMSSDTNEVFNSIDINNDGLISLEEFVDAVKINQIYMTCVSNSITSSIDI